MIKKISKKGFTLIELLVVIAIIGILASIVMVSMNSTREKARDVRRVSDMRQISLALELYYDDHGGYPADTTSNDDDWTQLTTALQTAPAIMASVPSDPSTGNTAYGYCPMGTVATANTAQDYTLQARLESPTNASLAGDVDTAVGTACPCSDNNGVSPDANRYYCINP